MYDPGAPDLRQRVGLRDERAQRLAQGSDEKVKDTRLFANMIETLAWTAVIWGFVSGPKVLGPQGGTRAWRSGVWVTFVVMTLSAGALP